MSRLPYGGLPPHVDTDTSKAASVAMETNAGTLRSQVLKFIEEAGGTGRTDDEIEDLLKMKGSTVRPRRRELEIAGKIRDSGQVRKTRSGRDATIWVVAAPRQKCARCGDKGWIQVDIARTEPCRHGP
jgi:hypothetical protein